MAKKFYVRSCFFDNGDVFAEFVTPEEMKEHGYVLGCTGHDKYDEWIDEFDDEVSAQRFIKETKEA